MRDKYLNAREKFINRKKPPPAEKKVDVRKDIMVGYKDSFTFSGENLCYTIIKGNSRAATISTMVDGLKKGESIVFVFHIKNISNTIESIIKITAPSGKKEIDYQYFFKDGDKVSVTVEYDEPLNPKGVWLLIEGY